MAIEIPTDIGIKRITKYIAHGGHSFLCRKNVTGERYHDGRFYERHINGIAIPDSAVEKNYTVEVIAKGPKVGQRCSKVHRKEYKRPYRLTDMVEIGDILLCPNRGKGLLRSRIVDYLFDIEENTPYAILRDGEIAPLGERYILEPDVEEMVGGLEMPDKRKVRTTTGTIVAVGPGVVTGAGVEPLPGRVGERACWRRTDATPVMLDGSSLVIVGADNLLGILE